MLDNIAWEDDIIARRMDLGYPRDCMYSSIVITWPGLAYQPESGNKKTVFDDILFNALRPFLRD